MAATAILNFCNYAFSTSSISSKSTSLTLNLMMVDLIGQIVMKRQQFFRNPRWRRPPNLVRSRLAVDTPLGGNISQAAQQGLAVLMASVVVVLKHETSKTQFYINWFQIWHGEVTSPAKVVSDPMIARHARMSGRDATTYPVTCYSSTELQHIQHMPVNRFSRAQ